MSVRFGAFEMDAARGELRRNGVPIRLQRQPFLVLALLVARAGDVVPREELQRALWPEGTFVDFDRGLNFCVNRIRRTLGEDARAPRYVETVARTGYRFIARVTVVPAPASPPLPASAPPRAAARRVPAALLVAAMFTIGGHAPPVAHDARGWDAPPAGVARAAYARGLYHARREGGGDESLRALAEAARLDPRSASVSAALARAWVRAVQEGRVAPREGMPAARAAAARALEAADHPEARLVLGAVALRHDWDWAAAERHLRRALVLDPALAAAHLELSDLLLVTGRTEEALRAADRAEALDPVCPVVRGQVGSSYYAARRFAEAAEAWRRSSSVAPALVGAHERLFHAYRHASRPAAAAAEAATVVGLLGGPSRALAAMPSDRAMAAFVDGTIAHLEKDAARAPALVADRLAVLNAILGRRADTLRWLAVAARERSTTLPVTLATDPDLDSFRDDPAFRALLHRLSLT